MNEEMHGNGSHLAIELEVLKKRLLVQYNLPLVYFVIKCRNVQVENCRKFYENIYIHELVYDVEKRLAFLYWMCPEIDDCVINLG